MRTSRAIALLALALPASLAAQVVTDSLRLFYVGKAVGWDRYSLTIAGSGFAYNGDLDYIDRGRRVRVVASATYASDYTPRSLDIDRVNDSSKTPVAHINIEGPLTTAAFPVNPPHPLSQYIGLIRYWESHNHPREITTIATRVPVRTRVTRQADDTLMLGGKRVSLRRYSIDGATWGVTYVWTDPEGRLAMVTTAGGGLDTRGVRAEYAGAADSLFGAANRAATADLAIKSRQMQPVQDASLNRVVALTGATLIDGTGKAAVTNATIVITNGTVMAAGPAASVTIPKGAHEMDLKGKTIIPGLWDSHAHLHQTEWIPAYLAAGITTVRDMGSETNWAIALRNTVRSGRSMGPSIVLAGLIDGPGPNAFGAVSAATPAEGRAAVKKYYELGFDEVKLYDLLAPDVVKAIVDEAHSAGMVVSGHIPRALGLRGAVNAGMDHIAHLSGTLASDSAPSLIAALVAKKTVMDPTVSWNEIGGHSRDEPMASINPGFAEMPVAFRAVRGASWGQATDTARAHAALARSITAIGALYKAGVPIIAGSDEGVPGFSIYRELELYVRAGMTPMDAIRSATSVPAKAMGLSGAVGTIEKGKRADLLILDADPLANISNVRTGSYVVKDGRIYERATLMKVAGIEP